MRRVFVLLGRLAAAGLLAALILLSVLYVGNGGEEVDYFVEPGASLRAVAKGLVDAEILDQGWKLRLLARIEGGDEDIKSGHYRLRRGASASRLLRRLVAGEVETVAVTFPEGWTAAQAARAFSDSLALSQGEFRRLVREPPADLRAALGLPDSAGLEGYLHPETYRFARGVSADRVVRTLAAAQDAVLDDSLRARMTELGVDRHELLTLASIVEAEAILDEERAKIAAVYWNRLRQDWKLEADPTVAYALDKVGDRLSFRDLEVESAYNTYRHRGLPPGPIGNPGAASIRAVLWPEEGFAAMYFVSDARGGHVFSETWEQHRAAVREYRRQRNAQAP